MWSESAQLLNAGYKKCNQQQKVHRHCVFVPQQTGEYATDEEENVAPAAGSEKSIEVFDLPENEDILSPSEMDANKLYQKFREVEETSSLQLWLRTSTHIS